MLKPVRKQSLSEAVFTQLRDQIVNGELAPGAPLPAERVLCEALGVNRGSVREALRRLQQSRLVSVRHGGTSQVLDYRASAGLDLLADLVWPANGRIDPRIVRGIIEMRSALAPDIARRAAERRTAAHLSLLNATLVRMREHAGDLPKLQDLAVTLWSDLVDASDNLAYRLAYNSLRATYDQCRELFTHVLADEIGDLAGYTAIVTAVSNSNGDVAARRARTLIERGERGIKQILDHLPANLSEMRA
jgi:DNA-binding FadR family transcriptional regulator